MFNYTLIDACRDVGRNVEMMPSTLAPDRHRGRFMVFQVKKYPRQSSQFNPPGNVGRRNVRRGWIFGIRIESAQNGSYRSGVWRCREQSWMRLKLSQFLDGPENRPVRRALKAIEVGYGRVGGRQAELGRPPEVKLEHGRAAVDERVDLVRAGGSVSGEIHRPLGPTLLSGWNILKVALAGPARVRSRDWVAVEDGRFEAGVGRLGRSDWKSRGRITTWCQWNWVGVEARWSVTKLRTKRSNCVVIFGVQKTRILVEWKDIDLLASGGNKNFEESERWKPEYGRIGREFVEELLEWSKVGDCFSENRTRSSKRQLGLKLGWNSSKDCWNRVKLETVFAKIGHGLLKQVETEQIGEHQNAWIGLEWNSSKYCWNRVKLETVLAKNGNGLQNGSRA
ncbi:hypothetical protein B0H16DRAFT_1472311 [Mycena metata]|uniref:Uncharacterized protein n=1 Tax=Mycena metata TaxID=1033252 RepID=A0AAD7MN72_9AGAR|nr:hypothetical protein B0H16DRAFT_1472311 [Mycena metata]